MTITINGLNKKTFNELIYRLDLFAGAYETYTRKEILTDKGGCDFTLFAISIRNANDITLKMESSGITFCRASIISSYFLDQEDFERIFIL